MSSEEKEKTLIRSIDEITEKNIWRVLLLLFPGQEAGLMGKFCSDMAKSWNGALYVAVLDDGRAEANLAKQTLDDALAAFEAAEISVSGLFHLQSKPDEGRAEVKKLVNRADLDLMLVRDREGVSKLVKGLNCDVGVVRGTDEELNVAVKDAAVERILIPSAGGPNTTSALALLRPLSKQCDISALYVVKDTLGDHGSTRGNKIIKDIIKIADVSETVEPLVELAEDHIEGISKHLDKEYDLVFIGATEDALSRVLHGNLVDSIVRSHHKPVIVMKRGHRLAQSYWERINWQIQRLMPNLSREIRTETYVRIRRNSRPEVSFYVLISLSAAIAGLGLLLNSPAVVIGAMLVAPLMSPIVGTGMAMVLGDTRFLRIAATTVLRGVLLTLGVSMLMGLFSLGSDQLPAEVLSRTGPSLFDLGVAFFSGLAGAYAICYSQAAGALPGVAISAALVPPLSAAGICFVTGNYVLAGGALLLFGTNFITIAVAAGLIFFLLGFRPTVASKAREYTRIRTARIALGLLVLNIFVLAYITFVLTTGTARSSAIQTATHSSLEALTNGETQIDQFEESSFVTAENGERVVKISAFASSLSPLSHEQISDLRDQIGVELRKDGYEFDVVRLELRVIDFQLLDPDVEPTPIPDE